MSATASSRADRWLWWGWLLFAGANTIAMFVFAGAETVPFHFVWISLSVVYGLQLWSAAVRTPFWPSSACSLDARSCCTYATT
jgi:hypothetical protein